MTKKTAPAPAGVEPCEIVPAWLSPKEASAYIGVGVVWFYKAIMPKVKTKKLGRLTRVQRVSLDRFMAELPDQGPRGLRLRGSPKFRDVILKPHDD